MWYLFVRSKGTTCIYVEIESRGGGERGVGRSAIRTWILSTLLIWIGSFVESLLYLALVRMM